MMLLPDNQNKIGYLEGLRGLAALAVVAHHFMLGFYTAAYDGNPERAHTEGLELWFYSSPLNVIANGNFCVMIFFVLSGFVLSHKYLSQGDFSILTNAAKRRYFRLFIPVGFTLLLSFILLRLNAYKHLEVSVIAHSEPWMGTLWRMDPSFGTWLEFFFYRVMFQGWHDYDTSMWTMSKELYGSFLVFGLLAITHKLKSKNIAFLAAIILAFLFDMDHYIGFFAGMMLFSLEKLALKSEGILSRTVLPWTLMAGGLLLGSFPSLAWAYMSWWDFIKNQAILDHFVFIHSIGAIMVVAAVIMSPIMQKILGTKPLLFLGNISFSLYLLHPLVLGSFASSFFLDHHLDWGYNKTGLITFILYLLLSGLLAWIMTITVDRFSIHFTKKLFKMETVKKVKGKKKK
ncbi:MAG: acyltransferase [Bacteroidia bacterium]|nr:acyltransferase [Bacteroidia bacterium]